MKSISKDMEKFKELNDEVAFMGVHIEELQITQNILEIKKYDEAKPALEQRASTLAYLTKLSI